MEDRDRLGELYPARDCNCWPGRAQSLIERRQGIVDRIGGDPPLRNGNTARKAIRKLRNKASAEQDNLRSCRETLTPGEPATRGFDVGARRRRQDRPSVGQRGAQIGIVPSLNPPRRQSGRGESREGGGAGGRRLAPFLLSELPRECSFGSRSIENMRGHRRITQPPPRTHDNHCARARAQAPARRSQQPGPWPSHARHPA